MLNKVITLPKALHELHGEKTRISTLGLVYLSGIAAAAIVVSRLIKTELRPWQVILVGLLFLDIGGGVAANLSSSTNLYYQRNRNLRAVFLGLHVFHPALMMIILPHDLAYFLFVMLFTLAAAFTLYSIKDGELQQNVAAFLVTAGVCLSFLFQVSLPVLYAFAPLFMVKLLLGFSVQRPPFPNIVS